MSGESESRRERWWPHLRAALVLFHLIAVIALSIPASASMQNRAAWRQPHARRELALWTERAQALGFDVDQREFEVWLWDLTGEYLGVRARIVEPFAIYASYTGARQGWPMFSTPQTEPCRLVIDVREIGGEWQEIYRERSASEDWMRRQLDHNRLRKLEGRLGRGGYGLRYRGMVEWLARRAARDFPEAAQLRSRVERRRTPDPFGPPRGGPGQARWERTIVIELGDLR